MLKLSEAIMNLTVKILKVELLETLRNTDNTNTTGFLDNGTFTGTDVKIGHTALAFDSAALLLSILFSAYETLILSAFIRQTVPCTNSDCLNTFCIIYNNLSSRVVSGTETKEVPLYFFH
jgi:hypothetical protein